MRYCKPKTYALAVLLWAVVAGGGIAQDFAFGWDPRTGDAWVDEHLSDINAYGRRYPDAFIDEIVRYRSAPRELVHDLVVNRHWAPGDVYYACAIAQIVGRPCRYVVDAWARDHAQGWGELAARLGVEPGSDAFHRLKRGFVPSYDRWNRPVELDADLRRAFPGRQDRPYAWSAEAAAKARTQPAPARGRGKPARGTGSASNAAGKDKR